jgi:hypothetical protein
MEVVGLGLAVVSVQLVAARIFEVAQRLCAFERCVNRSSLSQTREYTRASLYVWPWQPLHVHHTPCHVKAQSALRSECVWVTACLQRRCKMWNRSYHNITHHTVAGQATQGRQPRTPTPCLQRVAQCMA